MATYYFATIPRLPPEIDHQNNTVELIQYLVKEGDQVKPGTPLMLAENWWARFQIEATGEGIISKTFFDDSGTVIKIGDPFMIIDCDGEDAPGERPTTIVKVIKIKREKLTKSKK